MCNNMQAKLTFTTASLKELDSYLIKLKSESNQEFVNKK